MHKDRKQTVGRPLLGLTLMLATGTAFAAPEAPQPNPSTPPITETTDEVVELSPFEVNSSEDAGSYAATSTLGGSRLKTDLRDVASSISVVTEQFLRDTASKNNQDLLVYTTGTEVGGLVGNFAGTGNGNNISENRSLVSPNNNTRVRGLEEADNTRDFFLTDIPWDSYNVDRVDLQRGPNSILFGVGSPAGIINTSLITANVQADKGKFSNTLSTYGSVRWQGDYNKVIFKNLLAIRVAALDDKQRFRQKPAQQHDKRVFVTGTFRPQLLPKEIGSPLTIRGNFEKGHSRSNRPRYLPPIDRITPFFDAANKLKGGFDPYGSTLAVQRLSGGNVANRNRLSDNSYGVPYLGASFGGTYDNSLLVAYNNGQADPSFARIKQIRNPGYNAQGERDNGLDGSYAELTSIAGFNEYAKNIDYLDRAAGQPSRYASAQKNFWKDRTLADPTVFDFFNNLYDGDNKREWRDFEAYNLSVNQTFFDNRLGFEGVYDKQENYEGATGATFGGTPFISVDVNKYTIKEIPRYSTIQQPNGDWYVDLASAEGGDLNPHFGEAYFGGSNPGAYSVRNERENVRFTGFGELRATDFFDRESLLAKILGRQRVTGLLNTDERKTTYRNWLPYAVGTEWAKVIDQQGNTLGSANRALATIVYTQANVNGSKVSNLGSITSASGLHLDRLRTVIDPRDGMAAEYWDNTWIAGNIFGDLYAKPLPSGNGAAPGSGTGQQYNSTQSENAANFKGWSIGRVPILSADRGQIDQLTTSAARNFEQVKSQGLTYQGFFFGGDLVPTYGWRKDKIYTYGRSGARDAQTAVVSTDIDLYDDGSGFRTEGQTRSWGVVGHLPRSLSKHLPWGTTLSAFYNDSSNFRPIVRFGFDTKPLPNPSGESKDYGIVIRTLQDRLSLKVTKFKTVSANASIAGGENATLGNQTYILNEIEGRGAGNITVIQRGLEGLDDSEFWFWNWKWADEDGFAGDGTIRDDAFLNSAAVAKQRKAMDDYVAGMPSQEWFTAFGYDLNVAAFKAAYAARDGEGMRNAFNKGQWVGTQGTLATITSATGGRINNIAAPVGTIDQTSEGYEFEVVAQPTKSWNVAVNASKVTSTRGELGASITDWIENQYKRWQGPAGDLRLWWAGDEPIRNMYNNGIWAAYQFQKGAKGQSAPEVRPWRFNVVTTYGFNDGFLKGAYVGGGYRWQDRQILGYRLNAAKDNLDADQPIYGASEGLFDFWAGYTRKLTDKVQWNIQLNVRNVFKDTRLIPISVQPDGTTAAARIAEGMAWSVANTFEF
ncbi:MAG: TonB-dependent receptor plug domain-containing protein [Opitutaceae bacterium]|nr:TonB-dependent receptor plug domain-containing protein [Opitutaceae bacterium]